MMRRPIVRQTRSRLLALLLASIVCVGASGFGHAGWDDSACDFIPVHHDHNAHRVQRGTLPTGPTDHCLFCHSLRSLGNGLVATHVAVADTAHAAAVCASRVIVTGRLLDPNAPSRAPPVLL